MVHITNNSSFTDNNTNLKNIPATVDTVNLCDNMSISLIIINNKDNKIWIPEDIDIGKFETTNDVSNYYYYINETALIYHQHDSSSTSPVQLKTVQLQEILIEINYSQIS